MIAVNVELKKNSNVLFDIRPVKYDEETDAFYKNRDYRLKLLSGNVREVTPRDPTREKFEIVRYVCEIINPDGSVEKGKYEVPKTNRDGELNYVIVKMIEADLSEGDVFDLGSSNGFVTIDILGHMPIEKASPEVAPVASEAKVEKASPEVAPVASEAKVEEGGAA